MRWAVVRLRQFYTEFSGLLALLLLFSTFRLFALLLFRPGGFLVDNSDYDFYSAWGLTQVAMGYTTFESLWTAYPPLFPAAMLPIFEWSSRIPPWVEPRLFFHLLFGALLLLFEIANLLLIYRLAWRLEEEAGGQPAGAALRAAVFYALLFAPVYTLLGWFEAMPLFFLLWGLDLLLSRRRGGWLASAAAAAAGFLVKLTPVLLLPVAVRWFGARLSLAAARDEWFRRAAAGNLLRPALYGLVFVAVAVGVGLPLARFNPELALSSFTVNTLRPPWQSLWALWEGYYGFGLVPVDMRNLSGLRAGGQWSSSLPWGAITVGFGAIYLWLYTRRYDWNRLRTPVAFTGISVIWLFLYSKGWSPQFVVWVLAFLVLLRADLVGVWLAVLLTALNLLESQVFLILLPGERWLLVTTVLARTLLLLAIAVEFAGQIWPQAGQRLRRLSVGAVAAVTVGLLVVLGAGAPQAAHAYQQRRLAEHPCRATLEQLQAEAGGLTRTLLMADSALWRELYPWLYGQYRVAVVDGYTPDDRPFEEVQAEKLVAEARSGEFWWVELAPPGAGTPQWAPAAQRLFAEPGLYAVDVQQPDRCVRARVFSLPVGPGLGKFEGDRGPIELRSAVWGAARAGEILHLVLYWQTTQVPSSSYTVFTQLFAPDGQRVAQQDNLPVRGLAPTHTWSAGQPVRDPYALQLPAGLAAGRYTLRVGLYDAAGKRLPVGGADSIDLSVDVQ